MKTRLLLVITILFGGSQVFAGGIRGTIKDSEGVPLQFASVFVNETGAGAVSNIEGYYELQLEPGDYTLVFQFLGYKSSVKEVSIGSSFITVDVALEAQTFTLQQVEVSGSGEDPAYTVMRKAIAKAEYHVKQIETYEAKAYIIST